MQQDYTGSRYGDANSERQKNILLKGGIINHMKSK